MLCYFCIANKVENAVKKNTSFIFFVLTSFFFIHGCIKFMKGRTVIESMQINLSNCMEIIIVNNVIEGRIFYHTAW